MSAADILVISDTHGNAEAVRTLLERYSGIVSAVIHLGDNVKDIAPFAKEGKDGIIYHIVNGNTDPPAEAYNERVIDIAGKRIFITHGHHFGVKTFLSVLEDKAKDLQVDACLFGHTHAAVTFESDGILFLNPGSTTAPAINHSRGYALLRITEEGAMKAMLFDSKALPL